MSSAPALSMFRQIVLPNDNIPRPLTEEERNLLAQFARFDIRLDDLLAKLDGMLELDFGSEERRLTSHFLVSEPGIQIEKDHIRRALEKRSAGEIDDDDLFRWSTMILLNDAYIWEGSDEDEIAGVLHELSFPKPRNR